MSPVHRGICMERYYAKSLSYLYTIQDFALHRETGEVEWSGILEWCNAGGMEV